MTRRPPFLPIYSHESDMYKGYDFSREDTRKGYLQSKMVYIGVRDWNNALLRSLRPPLPRGMKRTSFCVPLPIWTYVTYCNLWVAKSGLVRNCSVFHEQILSNAQVCNYVYNMNTDEEWFKITLLYSTRRNIYKLGQETVTGYLFQRQGWQHRNIYHSH